MIGRCGPAVVGSMDSQNLLLPGEGAYLTLRRLRLFTLHIIVIIGSAVKFQLPGIDALEKIRFFGSSYIMIRWIHEFERARMFMVVLDEPS